MTADMQIIKLTTQLEEAGGLGLLAAGVLAPFLLVQTDNPGAFSGTNTGFVWSKTMGGNLRDESIPFGIGKLKMKSDLFSATVGVELTKGLPSNINVMVSLGEGGDGAVLEIDPDVAVLADKIPDPFDAEKIIGYRNPGEHLEIPIDLAALEFTFHLDLFSGDIRSSMVLHNDPLAFTSSQIGVFELDLNKVIVFPKVGDLGLYVKKLFVDLTESASTSFTKLFPEVYDPSWKGFGAQDVTLLYPIDQEVGKEEFVNCGVRGFMYGIDQGFSGTFHIDYTDNDTTKWIGHAFGEIEVRNNNFLKSTVAVDLNLKKLSEFTLDKADNLDLSSQSEDDQNALETSKNNRPEAATPIPEASYLRCQLVVVKHRVGTDEVFGFELTMTDASIIGRKSTTGLGIDIEGQYAQALFISGIFVMGAYLFKMGADDDDGWLKFAGAMLLLLVAADVIGDIEPDETAFEFLPTLEKLSLTQLGIRHIHIKPDGETSYTVTEGIVGAKLSLKLDGALISALEWFTSKTNIVEAFNAGAIFGYDLSNIDLNGNIDISISNINITDQAPPAHIGRLFDRKNLVIKALRMPQLHFKQDADNPGGVLDFFKSELIIKNREGGKTWYGLALLLAPRTGPSATIDFPAGGIVIYFHPSFDYEFVAQLAQKPGVTYLIPNTLLAKGTFDINKPIPAFSGTQNRITVDVGAFSALPPLNNPSAKDKAKRKKELLVVSNYKYQFSGEVAWGDALPAVGPQVSYDFYYVQVGYKGKSPLFTLGSVGFYGFDVIYGNNIAPGYPSGKPTALGIADWITNSPDPKDPFNNVRDWPDIPIESKWHPAIYWDEVAEEFKNKHVAGLTVHAGSAGDGGKTFDIQALVLMGFREFWIAVAAQTKIKPINLKATAIFAYDNGDWLFRFIAQFKKNDDGSFILAKFPVEFGSSSTPEDKGWFYFGHYDKKHGGPAIVDIFSGRYVVKFFLVYDTAGLDDFGLMPFETIFKPDIPGPAWGVGGIFQIGPKKYGPSFLNLKMFAAVGFNLAYRHDPTFLFGELYAGGYMQLKVVVIKFKLELLAQLQGMAIEDEDRWMGALKIKLNLPWPLSDVEESFDFILQSSGFTPVPPIGPIESTASALARLETKSHELLQSDVPAVPIDSIIALAIGRPIADIIHPETQGADGTTLLVNSIDPLNAGQETMTTDYQGVKYIVEYRHELRDLSIKRRPLAGGDQVEIVNMAACWNLPVFDENGEPLPGQENNRVLYLNGLMSPELQFNSEGIGTYNTWQNTTTTIHPCQLGGSACIMDVDPQPNIIVNTVPQAIFNTILGKVAVHGVQIIDDLAIWPDNTNSLTWSNGPHHALSLPFSSWVKTASATRAQFSLGMLLSEEIQVEELMQVVNGFRIHIGVDLRGRLYADRLRFNIRFTPSLHTQCGFDLTIENQNFGNDELLIDLMNAPCLDGQLPGCQIGMTTVNASELIEKVHITGYTTLLHPDLDWGALGNIATGLFDRLSSSELLLTEFCIERAQLNPGSWEVLTTEGGQTPPSSIEEALNNILNKQLFEPDHEYTIDYSVETFAKTYTEDEEGGISNESGDESSIISTGAVNAEGLKMETIVFKTEAAPTQNVAKYLGFTFPNGRTEPVYPASAVPLISLKYQGLIQKIYQKHYGADVLNAQMVDINGDVILPQQVFEVDLYSSPADQSVQDMLETCVPMAQTMTELKVMGWAGALSTEMNYSLQMVDTSDPAELKLPINHSFKTSRYASFADQIGDIIGLAQNGRQEAVSDSSTVGADIAEFFSRMTDVDGSAYSFDGAIERFYRDILSRDGGQMGEGLNEDSFTFLVGLDPADPAEPVVWGVVLELTEALLNKRGVALNIDAGFEHWRDVGLHKTIDGYLVLQDTAAGRVVILNSADGYAFTPFNDDLHLGINFDAELAVRHEIEGYVASAYPDKDATEQAVTVNETMAEIRQINGVNLALTGDSQILTIPLPQDV